MRVAFFGSSDFAVPALRACASQVVAVVTQPDKPQGRGMGFNQTAVATEAERLRLRVLKPERCRRPEFLAELARFQPEALLVAAYGQILPQVLLDLAALGAWNLHGSILPRWRGAAPIQRSIMAGDEETGVTLMRMDAGMDTGDVAFIARATIQPDETSGELTARLATLAAEVTADWLPRIEAGEVRLEAQDSASATYAPKILPEDALIDLRNPAGQEYNRYRGVTPSPGARLVTARGSLRLLAARSAPGAEGVPGTIIAVKPELVVSCGQGALALIQVVPPGKKPMSGRDYANGARLSPGDCLLEGLNVN